MLLSQPVRLTRIICRNFGEIKHRWSWLAVFLMGSIGFAGGQTMQAA